MQYPYNLWNLDAYQSSKGVREKLSDGYLHIPILNLYTNPYSQDLIEPRVLAVHPTWHDENASI